MALNEILATTAGQFIDIALGFTGILILYYIYRLFTVGEKDTTGDAELEGRREAAGRWIRDRRERAEHQAGATRRRNLLEPARGFLIRTEQTLQRLQNEDFAERTPAAVRDAREHAESVIRNLRSAARVMRAASAGVQGNLRDQILRLYNSCEATRTHVENNILHDFPDAANVADWDDDTAQVRENAHEIIGFIGQLINAIDSFIENDQLDAPDINRAGMPPARPNPSPGVPRFRRRPRRLSRV